MSTHGGGWEPDPSKMGNWRAMFEQPRGAAPEAGQPAPAQAAPPDDEGAHDLDSYKPWLLQRGRSRPSLMLALRRFDPRAGLWQSWAMPYHGIQAIEAMGDRMLSIDFGGTRQFIIEGRGLDELARRIGEGAVVTVLEYAAKVWPEQPEGAVVAAIKPMNTKPAASPRCDT